VQLVPGTVGRRWCLYRLAQDAVIRADDGVVAGYSVLSCSPGHEIVSMQEYDLYINLKKPAVGLYVRAGAGLPDFADPNEWVFDGTAPQDLLPAGIVQGVEANGHALRDMD
jgi:hypothetical protein